MAGFRVDRFQFAMGPHVHAGLEKSPPSCTTSRVNGQQAVEEADNLQLRRSDSPSAETASAGSGGWNVF